jgi:hypothetical protein
MTQLTIKMFLGEKSLRRLITYIPVLQYRKTYYLLAGNIRDSCWLKTRDYLAHWSGLRITGFVVSPIENLQEWFLELILLPKVFTARIYLRPCKKAGAYSSCRISYSQPTNIFLWQLQAFFIPIWSRRDKFGTKKGSISLPRLFIINDRFLARNNLYAKKYRYRIGTIPVISIEF